MIIIEVYIHISNRMFSSIKVNITFMKGACTYVYNNYKTKISDTCHFNVETLVNNYICRIKSPYASDEDKRRRYPSLHVRNWQIDG